MEEPVEAERAFGKQELRHITNDKDILKRNRVYKVSVITIALMIYPRSIKVQ